ncbi:DUF3541 domain-containing protein [Vibrio proteolyticus]
MLLKKLYLSFTASAVLFVSASALALNESQTTYQQSADIIRHTYETQLYTLPAFKEGHYALRMYRQTLDPKYAAAIWSDLARVASRLNECAEEINTPEQVILYSEKRLNAYLDDKDERSVRRYNATKSMPEYLYIGVGLLGSMARADEYGLKHVKDKQLRQLLRQYDFTKYVSNKEMVKAWAAQLANQAFWLRQLGEQDVVDLFIKTFRETYPDSEDSELTKQQYGNKLYGMTHIVFADSRYYQHKIDEQQYPWIYDYMRRNIDTILLRAKEDVIAEVGLTFLLAGLDNDPVVEKTRRAIQASLDLRHGMIPSTTGDFDLEYGEHRNVLAIMLLDWQSVNVAPTLTSNPGIFLGMPYGLIAK